MILECPKCGNKPHQQDTLHGKGKRVHTHKAIKEKALQEYRCTVCNNVRTK